MSFLKHIALYKRIEIKSKRYIITVRLGSKV